MKKRIKNYLVSAALCVAFIGVFACSADKETPQNLTIKELSVSTNKIDFQSVESNVDVTVTTGVTA